MNTTLIVPCYNEERRFDINYWSEVVSSTNINWCFVNDGSTDRTRQIIEKFGLEAGCQVINLTNNVGKAEAIRQAIVLLLGAAKGPSPSYFGFLDSDGAFDSDDISTMTELVNDFSTYKNYDAIWSSRVRLAGRDIQRNLKRHYIGRVIASLVALGRSDLPYDTQSGFKLFKNSAEFRRAISTPFCTRWLFEIEIIERWRQINSREIAIWEYSLNHWHEVSGSHIRGREISRIIYELMLIKRYQYRGN